MLSNGSSLHLNDRKMKVYGMLNGSGETSRQQHCFSTFNFQMFQRHNMQ